MLYSEVLQKNNEDTWYCGDNSGVFKGREVEEGSHL